MSDPITLIATWLQRTLTNLGLLPGFVTFLLTALGVVVVATLLLLIDILLVWVERKIVARFQDRFGPNRLGPFGLIQPLADIIKLLIKEDITPIGADRIIYNLAPIMAMATVLLIWAVIPFAPTILGTDINIGVLYFVAIGGLGTLSIIMAGWASNNKYALLGAFRTVAQIVSYEVPMVIALLIPVILARSMGINQIVNSQNIWFVVYTPLALLVFLITSIAELGRTPFDLSEAESEIVAGYHIEYTGMKFGLFYAGELLHALTVSALASALFLGGWQGPFVNQIPILGVVYLFIKSFLVYFVIMWIRYSFPRFRIDQMLNICWKLLTPVALALLILSAILDKLLTGTPELVRALSHFGLNVVILVVTVQLLRSYASRERQIVSERRPIATMQVNELKETAQQG